MSEYEDKTPDVIPDQKTTCLPKKVFDILRIAQLTLTGLAALFPTIGRIWGWPVCDLIGATCAALATFLGIYLKVDTTVYAKEIGL